MSPDLEKIFAAKRVFHRGLAERPVAEKLRMLDALRQRELAIRGKKESGAPVLREAPPAYSDHPGHP